MENGRLLVIKKGALAIAGVRTKTAAVNGAPVEVTSDDDSGFRTLLADPATMSLDLTVEGVTKDDTLRAAIMAGAALLLTDITIEYPGAAGEGGVLAGDFFLTGLQETGAHDDAIVFSASLQSSGAFVYTPTV